MATSPLVKQLYPLATQDGKPIPLDVVKAVGLIVVDLTTTFQAIVLDSKYSLAVVYSEVGTLLDLANGAVTVPVSGTDYPDWQFIPAGFAVACILPVGTIRVASVSGTGKLCIQGVQQWQVLALPRQATAKVS